MAVAAEHETGLVIIHDAASVLYASPAARSLLGLAANGADHPPPVPELVTEPYRDALGHQFDRLIAGEAEALALTATPAREETPWKEAVILSSPVRWDGDDRVLSVVLGIDPARPDDGGVGRADIAPIGITISDIAEDDLPVKYVNDDFAALTGYDRDEVLGKSLRIPLGAPSGGDLMAAIDSGIEAGTSVTVDHRADRKNGETFWNRLTTTPLFDADDELTQLLCTHRDITPRLAAERELTLFDDAAAVDDTAMFVTDTQGVIEFVNEPFERATGYAFEEAVGQTPRDLRAGEQGRIFYQTLSETIAPGEVWDSQVTVRPKSGGRYVVDRTIVPTTDRDGQLCNFVTIEREPVDRSPSE